MIAPDLVAAVEPVLAALRDRGVRHYVELAVSDLLARALGEVGRGNWEW